MICDFLNYLKKELTTFIQWALWHLASLGLMRREIAVYRYRVSYSHVTYYVVSQEHSLITLRAETPISNI